MNGYAMQLLVFRRGFFVFFERYEERLIDEKVAKRKRPLLYALYNSSFVRKYGVTISVWINLFTGSHSVKYL